MAALSPEHGSSMEAEEAEVTSGLQVKPESGRTTPPRPPENDAVFPPAWQSSIYSRTLDEIHNSVCEHGKNFGSMNMDEFLTNLWNAEEGFVSAGAVAAPAQPASGPAPLNRQGSLNISSPLNRKTVDEVWAEIQCEQQQGRRRRLQQTSQPRQPTFGEMTLEDFLIKAGVVREGHNNPAALSPMQAASVPPPQYGLPQSFGHVYSVGAVPNGRRVEPYCFSGEDGIGAGLQLGMEVSPVSPISSDGMGGSGGFPVNGYVVGKNGSVGRKRMPDGAVEVVVERRQRRMIKNRESAARSRARKQAYTVELEAELNQLKEENFRLREEERMARQIRKQMLLEAMAKQARCRTEKGSIRRCYSSPS